MPVRVEPDTLYSTDDVARMFGLKSGAVRRWIRLRRLPASKIGKRYWVRGAALLELVAGTVDEGKTSK